MKPRGAPFFSRRIQRASLFTRGYAFSISYNVSTMESPEVAKQTSSATRRLTCRTSSTPKACCSSSMNCVENSCSLLAAMRAMIFTPTLSKVTPRLASFPCCFSVIFSSRGGLRLRLATLVATCLLPQNPRKLVCVARCPVFLAMTRSRKSFGAHLSISTVTPSSPGALHIFMLRIALVISVAVGVSTSGAGSTLGEVCDAVPHALCDRCGAVLNFLKVLSPGFCFVFLPCVSWQLLAT